MQQQCNERCTDDVLPTKLPLLAQGHVDTTPLQSVEEVKKLEVEEQEIWYQCPALHLLEPKSKRYGAGRQKHGPTNGLRQFLHLSLYT